MNIRMNLGINSYDILVERGALARAGEQLNLKRRVFIITDEGVPAQYAACIAAQCGSAHIETVKQGEGSKSLAVYEQLLKKLLELGFDRGDCVVAVGGGVVGDLAGFVAASYMRGIDFYNIPTTVLSQIDSSIGGKVAVNLGSIKNIVGAFYQPKKVLIDPEVLSTLPARQLANGLAEAVKMSLTSDAALFELFETRDALENIDEIIIRSLNIKKAVVEQDEKEAGLRKILNFGHSIGHGIESKADLYHGECVALGMLPMCAPAVRSRVEKVLKKLSLPVKVCIDADSVIEAMRHDKKMKHGKLTAVFVDAVGSFEMKEISCESLTEALGLIAEGGR